MTFARHAGAVAGAIAIVLASSGAWLLWLQAGPPLGGWVAGATVIVPPIGMLILAVGWLAFRLISGRWIMWNTSRAALVAGLGAIAATVIVCGPTDCYISHVSNRFVGWFMLIAVAGSAFVHQFILSAGDTGPQEPRGET